MASLNKVMLLGNLTRDPDLRYLPSGMAVCEMGLAVSNGRRVVNGQEQEDTCFVDIIVWSKQAETCKQYLTKGSSILLEGRLQLDTWEDRNGGGRRSRLRVVAERVQFLNTRRSDNNTNPQGDYNNANYNSAPANNYNNAPQQSYNNNAYANNQYSAAPTPPAPPAMPEAAFNPADVDDDIPF